MNRQRNLTQELMLYEFDLDHNAAKTHKNICCAKDEGAIDYSIVTRCLKNFRSDYKNLDD